MLIEYFFPFPFPFESDESEKAIESEVIGHLGDDIIRIWFILSMAASWDCWRCYFDRNKI